MLVCRACRGRAVEPLLDLGEQPLCNRFLTDPGAGEVTFPFALGQCGRCGIIQLLAPVPAEELRSRFDWITYREAEGHLDELVDELCKLPGVTAASVVGAVSSKDDSTVARLQKRGFPNTWRIDIEDDLGADSRGAGLETVQLHLHPPKAEAIAQRRGAADLLIARHIVEHAHDPASFVAALRRMVKPNGYIVLELPDCGPALQRGDYTIPWEDHVLYLTADLLRQAAVSWGLRPVSYRLYPYSHENSLVVIARPGATARTGKPDTSVMEAARALGEAYARAFPAYRRRAAEALAKFRHMQGKIAVFGAGHLSCAWINFLGIRDHLDFVVDDDPHKRGLFMPGSRLPILSSQQLIERGIKMCLLSLSQESEAKVIKNNQTFLDCGGRFASIFPGKPSSFM